MIRKKIYQIAKPLETHSVKATCEEVTCENWQWGWVSKIDESTSHGQIASGYIRTERAGQFKESKEMVKGKQLTCFWFEPGNRCFESDSHRKSLDREAFYFVHDGGHSFQHDNGLNWVEDFDSHQNKLLKAQR